MLRTCKILQLGGPSSPLEVGQPGSCLFEPGFEPALDPRLGLPAFNARALQGTDALIRRRAALAGLVPALWLGSASARESLQGVAGAQAQGFWDVPREVWLRRPATGEEIKVVYFADGQLVMPGYLAICHLMRDVRMERRLAALRRSAGGAAPVGLYSQAWIDIVTVDILYALSGWLKYHGIYRPILLTSGFRHAATNEGLEGAAKDSHHVRGGAADVRVPGVSQDSIGRYGVWLRAGGVGFYPGLEFTHVDSGRLRQWRGANPNK